MSYRIQLENFEGPLDLLIYFIRRDELDIYDIPIAKITKDFMAVVEEWKRLNMMIAGEFIVMASTLMRVKAKMLIPRPELDEDGFAIDPREGLENQLIDYTRYRNLADNLRKISIECSASIPRQFEQQIMLDKNKEFNSLLRNVTLYDLATVFKGLMDTRPVITQFELNREPIKLEQQKEFIFKFFDGFGIINLKNLIKNMKSRMEIIVTFLAILDLVKEGACSVSQKDIFSDIQLVNLRSIV